MKNDKKNYKESLRFTLIIFAVIVLAIISFMFLAPDIKAF